MCHTWGIRASKNQTKNITSRVHISMLHFCNNFSTVPQSLQPQLTRHLGKKKCTPQKMSSHAPKDPTNHLLNPDFLQVNRCVKAVSSQGAYVPAAFSAWSTIASNDSPSKQIAIDRRTTKNPWLVHFWMRSDSGFFFDGPICYIRVCL